MHVCARACIAARTKEFARADATSLRFLSNGGTPLLSRTLHDYVHFLPLPREYVRIYVPTPSSEPAFYSGCHSARRPREKPRAIAAAASLANVRSHGRADSSCFLVARRILRCTPISRAGGGKWETRLVMSRQNPAVGLYLRG